MKIEIEATGGPCSGKTYILTRLKQLLEDKNFSVEFPGKKCDVPHEHTLVATRPDDWVRKNIAGKKDRSKAEAIELLKSLDGDVLKEVLEICVLIADPLSQELMRKAAES